MKDEKEYKECPICGRKFLKNGAKKYCSDRCYRIAQNDLLKARRQAEKIKIYIHCPICGKEFLKSGERRVYCSDICKKRGLNKKRDEYHERSGYVWKPKKDTEKVCPHCGKTFIGYKRTTYCSRSCASAGSQRRKYKLRSEKKEKPRLTIQQISEAARKENMTYGQYVTKYNL